MTPSSPSSPESRGAEVNNGGDSRSGGFAGIALRVGTIAFAALSVTLALTAPADAVQGDAQRLMYLHVPAAWSAYLSFAIVMVSSVVYLRRRTHAAAVVARTSAQVGLVLTALTLVSGMVWGSLTWGTAWVWDARTTSTLAMGAIYVAYLAARALERGSRSRSAAAWLGVLGFAIVPVVHLSVDWWRTLHQSATILTRVGAPPIDGAMALALGASVVTATLVTAQVIVALKARRLRAVDQGVAQARRRSPFSADLPIDDNATPR